MKILNIIGENAPDICPACAPPYKVEFLVTIEVINDGVLIHCGRISARGIGNFNVRNAGDHRPHPPRGTVCWRKAMVEVNAVLNELIEKRGCIERVAMHGAFVSAERFTDDQNNIWFYCECIGWADPPGKIQWLARYRVEVVVF